MHHYTMLRLFIIPTSNAFAELYRSAADAYNTTPVKERNSGFDLFCDASAVAQLRDDTILVDQGCRAVAVDTDGSHRAFWLAPRSSISKTPWILANSLGLIDATYRGVLKAALRGPSQDKPDMHQRLAQVAAGDLRPWSEVIVVDELPTALAITSRGAGGFGSTG